MAKRTSQLLAALADFKREHIVVAQERDAIDALRVGLYHLHGARAVDAAIIGHPDVIMQRNGVMSPLPDRGIYLLLCGHADGMGPRHHADIYRASPKPPQAPRLVFCEIKRIDEELKRLLAELPT